MAQPNILVVDSDEGFGLMLKEGLENSGQYQAKLVHTGSDALESVVEENFDLVIMDMALTDVPSTTLIQAIREAKNEMRIMMISLMGQDLPEEIEALEVNGILPKPFFVGDLPYLVDEAMDRRQAGVQLNPEDSAGLFPAAPAQPVSPEADAPPVIEDAPVQEAPPQETPPVKPDNLNVAPAEVLPLTAPAVSQETVRFLRANESEILRLLDDLNREVRAEAILLIAGVELIAQAGMLRREQCQNLTMLVAQSSQAAAQAASFLGETAGRFAQSLHEGEEYRLYSLSLGEGILLSLALSSNVPLGMIRHQCRQIAGQLAKFII